MPAQGGGAPHNVPHYPAPKPPKPAPPPRPVHMAAPSRAPLTSTRTTVGRVPGQTFHDAGSGDYGVKAANRFKTTPQYHAAVKSVFLAQKPQQQGAIIRGLMKTPYAFRTPEGRAVFEAWHSLPVDQATALQHYLPHAKGINVFSAIGSGLSKLADNPMYHSDKNATGTGYGGMLGTATMFGGRQGAEKIFGNAGKDLWNIGPGTVEGLYSIASDIQKGHFGNAISSFVDPLVHTILHPAQSVYQHPVNSLMILGGPEAAVGRLAGGLARAGTFGDRLAGAASTARADLNIGTIAGEPAPIVESRSYSPNVFTKALQTAREGYLRKRGQNPEIARPAPGWMHPSVAYALNIGKDAKLQRAADEMTAVRQMMGRQERARVLHEQLKAHPGAGANIVTHVLQRVIRKPDTAVEDIAKEINRLKAAQTGKRTAEEILNRKQVRDLSAALKDPAAIESAFAAAEKINPTIQGQDAMLAAKGLLEPDQAMRSKLFPYAIAHMGARYDKAIGELVHADGSKLPTQEILDHLKENGVPDPAFVAHNPGKAAPWNFYRAYRLARGTLNQGRIRTGEGFRTGAYDHTWEGLAGQLASRAEAVTRASLHDNVINRLAVVPGKELLRRLGIRSHNGLFTPGEAKKIAGAALVDHHGNPIPNALELTPISARPISALAEVRNLQHPQELQNLSGIELKALAHAVEDAASRNDQTRNVALIPTVAADRFAAQFAKADATMKSIGRVTQQFRRTVLPYSTHWMLQIGSEAALRAILAGVFDPRYLRDGRRLVKRLEHSEAGRAAAAEMVNATFYNARDPLAVHNPNPGMVSSAARAFPPARMIIWAHNRYADTIGQAMYTLEHNARMMGLGKLAHQEVQAFGHSWRNAVKLQGRALEELAQKLETNPALVAKFGRAIDDTFGKYNKFTPRQRAAIQSLMPFLPWYLNAAKYVFWHLPAKHPVASALMASLRQTINQDIQDGKKLPLNAYAMQELGRISPFGIFTPPTSTPSTGAALAGQQFTGAVAPQAEGALFNLAGVNSFGEGPLKQPPSGANYKGDTKPMSGPALAAAVEGLLESFLPLARYGRLLREKGKPAYGTSTILSPQTKNEPGTSVLNRMFNPFYSFERAGGSGPAFGPQVPAASSSSRSSNPWSGGGSNPWSGGSSNPWK